MSERRSARESPSARIHKKAAGKLDIAGQGKKVRKKTASAGIPYMSGTSKAMGKVLSDFNTRTLVRMDNALKSHLSKARLQEKKQPHLQKWLKEILRIIIWTNRKTKDTSNNK